MKKYILFLLMVLTPLGIAFSEVADNWNTTKSTHFIVYYKNAPGDFIEGLINRSEDYYDMIAEGLGFTRYKFWLWDNRAKIYVYDNVKEYQSATGQPNWSSGAALPQEKTIHTFFAAEGFMENVLPHEMGHIIFREFVGFDNPAIPRWLDEGVASYQENLKYPALRILLKQTVDKGNLMTIGKLSDIELKSIADPQTAQLFYAEAASIVDYLVREYGKDNFAAFCAALRDKRDLRKAIGSVYSFSSIEELNEGWQKYLTSN